MIKVEVFEFSPKRRLRLGMDAQGCARRGGGDFIKIPILTDFSEIWTEWQKNREKVIKKSDF